ncbi:hypothetical protein [Comamonas sp. UBA7528]|uniref:hypothetical protein n=1 Tax=Comamonas sp. UBA7528 TaxID=1946391 RepID=UPI0025BD8A30|nr:hypothetical protein [Comamonas sp. UBA7528]
MGNIFLRYAVLIFCFAAFLFFGNLSLISWKINDWWAVLACFSSFLAILGFCFYWLFDNLDFAGIFYKFAAFAATAFGCLSFMSSLGEATKDAQASVGLPSFFLEISMGQIRTVDRKAQILAENSIVSCAIGPYLKYHSLIGSATEIVYFGPLTSMLFGIVKSDSKEPADCIDLYRELITIQPNLEKHLALDEARELRERIEARRR